VMKKNYDAAHIDNKEMMGNIVADIIMAASCSILAFTMSMVDLSEENMELFIEHLANDMRELYHNYLRNYKDDY
jgi:hypothetical protein